MLKHGFQLPGPAMKGLDAHCVMLELGYRAASSGDAQLNNYYRFFVSKLMLIYFARLMESRFLQRAVALESAWSSVYICTFIRTMHIKVIAKFLDRVNLA